MLSLCGLHPPNMLGASRCRHVVLAAVPGSATEGPSQSQNKQRRRRTRTAQTTPRRQPHLESASGPQQATIYYIPKGYEAAAQQALLQSGTPLLTTPGQQQHNAANLQDTTGTGCDQHSPAKVPATAARPKGHSRRKQPAQQPPAQPHDASGAAPTVHAALGHSNTTHPYAEGTNSSSSSTEPHTSPKPPWAVAVDRGVAALSSSHSPSTTRSARNLRWSQRPLSASAGLLPLTSRASSSGSRGQHDDVVQQLGPRGPLAIASFDEVLQGGELSAEGEQQLCQAYQRFIQFQQLAAQANGLHPLMQQAPEQLREQLRPAGGSGPASTAAVIADPASIQREGLLAKELLLQLFEPLVINRAKRAQTAGCDLRELLAAARQGFLRAAARFDAARVAGGTGRLYALADRYISTALRDVMQEYQSAVVHVPTHVREVASRLRRAEQQLQLQLQQRVHGQQPELSEVAAAAGVSLKHAQQALAATGGALQAVSLQHVEVEKEQRGRATTGVDLQQVDVSVEEDSAELSEVVGAGALAAARSGLEVELDAAAERALLDELLQGMIAKLQPEDRELLQVKLEGGNIAQAARGRGWSRQWGQVMVQRVVQQLRRDMLSSRHDVLVTLSH